eukprot:Rmarinus@m.29966
MDEGSEDFVQWDDSIDSMKVYYSLYAQRKSTAPTNDWSKTNINIGELKPFLLWQPAVLGGAGMSTGAKPKVALPEHIMTQVERRVKTSEGTIDFGALFHWWWWFQYTRGFVASALHHFDRDSVGSFDARALKDVFRTLCPTVSDAKLAEILKTVQFDGNGRVALDFIVYWYIYYAGTFTSAEDGRLKALEREAKKAQANLKLEKQQNRKNLEREREELMKTIKNLENTLLESRQEVSHREEDLRKHKEDLDQARFVAKLEKNSAERRIKTAEDEVVAAKKELENKSNTMAELRAEIEALRNVETEDIAKIKKEHIELSASCDQLTTQRDELISERASLHAKVAEFESQVKQLEAEKVLLEGKVEGMRGQMSQAKADAVVAEHTKDKLESARRNSITQASDLQQKVEDLTHHVTSQTAAHDAAVASLKTTYDNLISQLKASHEENLSQLKSSHAEAMRELRLEWADKVSALEDEHRELIRSITDRHAAALAQEKRDWEAQQQRERETWEKRLAEALSQNTSARSAEGSSQSRGASAVASEDGSGRSIDDKGLKEPKGGVGGTHAGEEAEAELHTYKARAAEAESEVRMLRESLRVLEVELHKKKKKEDQAAKKNDDVQASEAERDVPSLLNEISRLVDERSELKAVAEERVTLLEALVNEAREKSHQETETSRLRREELLLERDEAENVAERLRSQIERDEDRHNQECRQLTDRMDAARRKVADLEGLVVTLQKSKDAEREARQQAETRLSALTEVRKSLDMKIADLEREMIDVKHSSAIARNSYDAMAEQLKTVEEKLFSTEKDLLDKAREVDDLRLKMEEYDTAFCGVTPEQVNELLTQVKTAEAEKEVAALKEASKASVLEAQLISMKAKQLLLVHAEDKQREAEAAREATRQMEELRHATHEQKSALMAMSLQSAAQKQRSHQKDETVSTLRVKLAELEKELHISRLEREDLEKKNKDLQSNPAKEEEARKAYAELIHAEKENSRQALAQAERVRTDLENKLQATEAVVKAMERQHEVDIARLEQTIIESSEKIEELQKEADSRMEAQNAVTALEMLSEVRQLRDHNSKRLLAEIERLRGHRQRLRDSNRKLTSEKETLALESRKVRAELLRLQSLFVHVASSTGEPMELKGKYPLKGAPHIPPLPIKDSNTDRRYSPRDPPLSAGRMNQPPPTRLTQTTTKHRKPESGPSPYGEPVAIAHSAIPNAVDRATHTGHTASHSTSHVPSTDGQARHAVHVHSSRSSTRGEGRIPRDEGQGHGPHSQRTPPTSTSTPPPTSTSTSTHPPTRTIHPRLLSCGGDPTATYSSEALSDLESSATAGPHPPKGNKATGPRPRGVLGTGPSGSSHCEDGPGLTHDGQGSRSTARTLCSESRSTDDEAERNGRGSRGAHGSQKAHGGLGAGHARMAWLRQADSSAGEADFTDMDATDMEWDGLNGAKMRAMWDARQAVADANPRDTAKKTRKTKSRSTSRSRKRPQSATTYRDKRLPKAMPVPGIIPTKNVSRQAVIGLLGDAALDYESLNLNRRKCF